MKANIFLSKLFDDLNKYKVKYAVLRNYEALPQKWSNDIDLIIEDEKKIISILTKLLNKIKYDKKIMIKKFFSLTSIILFFEDRNLRLDLFNNISYGWIQYANKSYIFKFSKKSNKNFYYVENNLSNILILIKEYLAYGLIRKKYNYILFEDKNIISKHIDLVFYDSFSKDMKKKILKLCFKKNYKFSLIFKLNKYFNLKNIVFWGLFRYGTFKQYNLSYMNKIYCD